VIRWPGRVLCWVAIGGLLYYLFLWSALWAVIGVGCAGALFFLVAEIDETLEHVRHRAIDPPPELEEDE
jgi:hypothetical protein